MLIQLQKSQLQKRVFRLQRLSQHHIIPQDADLAQRLAL
uniref:Uncharacterized protein n=1 Tax=Arundo donax TaxID=35708 RepID=A0A0A9G4V2_ARUDO